MFVARVIGTGAAPVRKGDLGKAPGGPARVAGERFKIRNAVDWAATKSRIRPFAPSAAPAAPP